MIELGTYHYLLFDGDCGICTAFAEFAKRVDIKNHFVMEPYQKFPEEELLLLGTNHSRCARKIHVIKYDGRMNTGAFALNYFFFHYFPWSILVVAVYVMLILLLFEVIGYAMVAKYRYYLSRWFGLKACTIRSSP